MNNEAKLKIDGQSPHCLNSISVLLNNNDKK